MRLRLTPAALALCLTILACAPSPAPTAPPLATAGRTVAATAAPTQDAVAARRTGSTGRPSLDSAGASTAASASASASPPPVTPSPTPPPSPAPPPAAWTPAERLPLVPLAPPPPGDISPDGLRLIDRVGSRYYASAGNVLLDGRRAFVSRDMRLQVIDLTDPASPVTFDAGPVGPGGPTLLPGGLALMAARGDALYGLVDWDRTGRGGTPMHAWLVSMDASNPRRIRVRSVVQLPIGAGRDTAGGESALLALDDRTIVVAGPDPDPDGARRDVLATIDTADPRAPVLRALVPLSGTLAGAALDGRTLYVLARHDDVALQHPSLADASASLTAVDLRDPAAPRFGVPARFARPAVDVQLVSGRAVVFSAEAADVFALADPAAPVAVAHAAPPTPTSLAPGWTTPIPSPSPSNPMFADYRWYMRPGAHAVLHGSLACVPHHDGIARFDLADIRRPRRLDPVRPNAAEPACPARVDGRPVAGLGYSMDGELEVRTPDDDAASSDSPSPIGADPADDIARRLAGIRRAAEFVATIDFGASVANDGTRLVAEQDGDIFTFDAGAEPPVRRWPHALPDGACCLATSGTRTAVALDESILVFDAFDPARRTVTGTVAISATRMAFDGTTLFIAVDERTHGVGPDRMPMLAAVDTADVAQPVVLSRLDVDIGLDGFAAGHGHVFVSDWGGIHVYALRDKRTLVRIVDFDWFGPSALALRWPVLLAGNDGLSVIDIANPAAPRIIAQRGFGFRPSRCPPNATCHAWPSTTPVTWFGSTLFVGDAFDGVWAFDASHIAR